jgi:hypothetical protein
LKNVIIISYFYPSCNLTASQRVESWAKYLNKSGYYPIIITRKWEKHITSFDDCHYSTSKEVLIDKNENYEVHYCPYSANLRDRLHTEKKFIFFKKALSFMEIVFQNIWVKLCPFNNFIDEAEKIIKSEKNIHSVIISGNPFIQFKFGYELNKKYNIPWIADYRDAWTTSTINNISGNRIKTAINLYQQYFEKKWVKTASYITASSIPIGESMGKLVNVKSEAIYNGFEPSDFIQYNNTPKLTSHFQIAYIGTLYDGQDISIFLDAYKKFIHFKNPNCKLFLPGLDLDLIQKVRVEKLLEDYEDYYKTSLRIPKSEILKIEKESHLLLHVAWKGHAGIIASKIYEYIGSGSKIIVAPGDGGSIDEIVKVSKSGFIFDDINSVYAFLCNEYDNFMQNEEVSQMDNALRMQFSRESQAMKLGAVLDKI